MNKRQRVHSLETRQEALRLWGQGVTPRNISARLLVPVEAVKYWIDYTQTQASVPMRTARKTRSGSGVIAPPAYRYGYSNWGKGGGW